MGQDDTKAGNPRASVSQTAAERLNQLSSHVEGSNAKPQANQTKKKTKKAKNADSALPADYSDVLEQLQTLRKMAATPDTQNRGYIRQKQAGKLWVRERIDRLLDPGTFREVGSVSGTVEWQQTGRVTEVPKSFVPSNNIQGMGTLRGRRVVMTADDFSIRSGHADGASSAKTVFLEKMAIAMKLPIVKLVDGSSGGGSVTTIKTAGWSYIPLVQLFHQVNQQLNMGIPNLGAVLGPAVSSNLCQFIEDAR
jgi:acetyl-CoA carboxylase carboxyltransferase component